MKIIEVDKIFQPKVHIPFPYHIKTSLEEYAYEYFSNNDVNTDLVYFPIYWASYHHLEKENKWTELEKYYKGLLEEYKGKKLFTVNQLSKKVPIFSRLSECLVFGASGIGDTPVPLLCSPHPVNKNKNPIYKVCFVGSLKTHVIRQQLFDKYANRNDFFFGEGSNDLFRNIMDNSTFCLCPRGTGKTSYRLYEALQMGCIPIYVYDNPWVPFEDFIEWDKICIMLHINKIDELGRIIDSMTEERISEYQHNIKKYSRYFTMDGCCETIGKILEKV